MKFFLPKIIVVLSILIFSTDAFAQTSGTLTVVFTPTVPSGSTFYSGTRNTLAAWIQSSTASFVETKLQYFGPVTSDHLPTWSSKSGGSTTGATTGATKISFAAATFNWDGKNSAETSVMADGTYQIVIEDCWNHGMLGIYTSTVSFVKGTSSSTVTPANTAYLQGVSVVWTPALTTNVDEYTKNAPFANVYPNPTSGLFTVDFKNATSIKIINTLGSIVYESKMNELTESSKTIDLTALSNGIYFVNVSNGTTSTNQRITLEK